MEMGSGKCVGLLQLLQSREARVDQQGVYCSKYHKPLISFMVNTPGPIKVTVLSQRIHEEGMKAIEKMLRAQELAIIQRVLDKKITGYEGYFVVDGHADVIKQMMIKLEETHPLGRLFDIDVLDERGIKLSRRNYGKDKRKCLICRQDVDLCRKTQAHTLAELNEKINGMYTTYKKRERL